MGLLKSVDNVPGIDFYEFRDQDYYGKYVYRARFTLVGIRHLMFASDIQELEQRAKDKRYGLSYKKDDKLKIIDNLPILSKLLEWKINSKKEKKATLRGEHNTLAVFSNDLSYLQTLEAIDPSLEIDYTEVQRSEYEGVKHFVKDPPHKFRVYLKSRRVTEEFPKDIKQLLDRLDGLHPSPALVEWLTRKHSWSYRWSSASYFIDYDDESTLSYLALMHGDMLGKKYKLEKRPEAT
jgi:hypothetical protein